MSIRQAFIWLLFGLLLTGCATERRTVHEGAFQKRRHQSGWHVDLGLRPRKQQGPLERSEPMAVRLPGMRALHVEGPALVPVANTVGPPRTLHDHSPRHTESTSRVQRSPALEPSGTRSLIPMEMQTDITPERRWNKWAVPAFVVALGAVALALFTTSTIAVIAALIVALVLSAISIKQIRWRDERGKGFAVAALVIAVMASIATAIVTAVVGFV